MIKKLMLVTVLAASLGGVVAPASAAVNIYLETAPPPLHHEAVPAARRGYVWVPGNWNARRGHYVWASGTWVRERPGYSYSAPTWVEGNGRWTRQEGSWAHGDRDHDGVPNAVDRHPDDPRRN